MLSAIGTCLLIWLKFTQGFYMRFLKKFSYLEDTFLYSNFCLSAGAVQENMILYAEYSM